MVKRITAPDYLSSVTLEEAKAHLRVTHADDDAYITNLVSAACEHVESLGQFWIGESVEGECYLHQWPRYNSSGECIAFLECANVISVDSVQYIGDGSTSYADMDEASYETSTSSSPAHVLVLSQPTLGKKRDAIKIGFTAGYDTLPVKIKQAVLLVVGNLYETRQEEIVGTVIARSTVTTVENLIRNHKLYLPV